jgi:ribulose-phosphate 3-epimerase
MVEICPTILASNKEELKKQLSNVSFANHIHIDFMDGSLTDSKSIALSDVEIPANKTIDLHIMYDKPQEFLDEFIKLKPNMVIVQAESHCDIVKLATDLRDAGIKTGLSILPETTAEAVNYILPHVQQVMIFSGNLGHFGGRADLGLLDKVEKLKKMHRWLEFGWDGGINDQNIRALIDGGIEVLSVGGFIQKAKDPQDAYSQLAKVSN